eukprot:11362945-Karenia_brevis.AAC.1
MPVPGEAIPSTPRGRSSKDVPSGQPEAFGPDNPKVSTPERTTTPKTKSPYATPDRKVRARTELHEKLAEKDQQLQ